MRIVQVLYYYTPNVSGLTVYAERLARHFTARGHQVTILASQHDPGLVRREVVDGITVIRAPVIGRATRGVLMPTFLAQAAKTFRVNDVVHLHLPMLETGPLAEMAKRMGKRVVLTHHTDLQMRQSTIDHVAEFAVFRSGLWATRAADTLVTYTHDRAAVSPFVQQSKAPVEVVYPPIELRASSKERVEAFRLQHRMNDAAVVGFAGRFAAEKGIDFLLDSLPLLQERLGNVILAFAGDFDHVPGEHMFEKLKPVLDKNQDSIRLLGPLWDQDLSDFYASLDVLVLPSINHTETFGLVQVEAMLCGTPVVTTDMPGVRETVRVTGMGRIVPPKDAEALAEALADVIEHRGDYVKPQEQIRSTFDIQKTIDAYERIYPGETAYHPETSSANPKSSSGSLRSEIRRHLQFEGDACFRRRCETIAEELDIHVGEKVLDCGSGYGFTLSMLQALTDGTFFGLELQRDRLCETRAMVNAEVKLAQGSLQCLPFADGSFDKLVCSEVLEHVSDDHQAMAEIARVLKPEGKAVITVPSENYPFGWDPPNWVMQRVGGRKLDGEHFYSGIWYGHERLYSMESLELLAEESQLKVIKTLPLTHYVLPFNHMLVYGIMKPLLQKGLVPGLVSGAADRSFTRDLASNKLIDLASRPLNWLDSLNDDPDLPNRVGSFVSLAVVVTRA